MIIDTQQVISKTRLRKDLSRFIALNRQGKAFVISDRGNLTSVLLPIDFLETGFEKKQKTFDILLKTQTLRKKLSRQNPNFDSLKALQEIRRKN